MLQSIREMHCEKQKQDKNARARFVYSFSVCAFSCWCCNKVCSFCILFSCFSVLLGYSPHPNYGMITQSDYTTGSNYGSYGSIAAYQCAGNSALGGPIAGGTTNGSIASSVNPYASSVIGSSNGYSNVLSISSGGIPSVSSCYPIPSSQHFQTDKNCTKDR